MKNTYKIPNMKRSIMKSVDLKEGITMEEQVARIMDNQADLERTAPLIYTERKEGVLAAYDIRTDRFEIAIEAMDKATKSETSKRDSKMSVVKDQEKGDEKTPGKDGKADNAQGTE